MPSLVKPRPYLVREDHSDVELFKRFLRLVKSKGRPSTAKDYRRVLGWFQDFLQDQQLTLRELKTEHIDAFLLKWEGRAAHHRYGMQIQAFLRFLGLLDPAGGLLVDAPPVKKNRLEEIRRQLISEEEFKTFLSFASGSGDLTAALMAAVLYETGLRVHEVVQLRWAHVDMEEGLLEIPKRKSGKRDSVPYGLYTQTYLRLLEPSGHNPDEPLLPSKNHRCFGDPLSENGVRYLIQQYGTLAQWRREQLHPHAFRHSFATNLVRRGVPLPVVQELMDHADIDSTMIYVNLGHADVLDAYRRVMRPDWTAPVEEGPATAPTCPDCQIVRLPGYKRCPACGFDFLQDPALTRKKRLLAQVLQDPEVEALLEEKLRDLIPREKEE